MEKKKIGQMLGRIREGWFAIPRYKTSLSSCIQNMTTQACTVLQKSLMKKNHYLKYGKNENRTNTGKKTNENAGSQSDVKMHRYQPANQK